MANQWDIRTGLVTETEIEAEVDRIHQLWLSFDAECCKENARSYWDRRVREVNNG